MQRFISASAVRLWFFGFMLSWSYTGLYDFPLRRSEMAVAVGHSSADVLKNLHWLAARYVRRFRFALSAQIGVFREAWRPVLESVNKRSDLEAVFTVLVTFLGVIALGGLQGKWDGVCRFYLIFTESLTSNNR